MKTNRWPLLWLLLPSISLVLVLPACRLARPGSGQRGEVPVTVPGTHEWYESNAPIVKEYLSTLPESAIGSVLPGIRLSDGRRWFEGHTYLGRPRDLPQHLRVTMLRREDQVLAYMWLEEGGEPFALRACEAGEAGKSGIRARRLAGGVLAWRSLRAEHGVVYTACPPGEWLPEPASDDRETPSQ